MIRYIPVALFAALFAVLAYGLVHSDTVNAPETSHIVGKELPALTLETLDHSTAFTAKNGVQIINIFASWCAPCIAELPEIAPLAKEKNVTLVGISWHDAPSKLRPWLKKYKAPYELVYRDGDNQTGVKLGIRGVPETYMVDSDGIVRFHHIGPVDAFTRDTKIIPLIREYQ